MSPSTTLPTLIVGGGISGLALAQGLVKAKIPFRLFERDPTPVSRAQGYRVRINGTGIAALKSLLTPALYARLEGSCAIITLGAGMGPAATLNAITTEPAPGPMQVLPNHFSSRGVPNSNVESLNCDRTVLRSVLLRGLEDHIEFGKEVSSYEITSKSVTVWFSDGSQAQGSLLVGADGSRSRVRKQFLPEHGLVDTEGRWIYGKTLVTPELVERFSSKAMAGMSLVQDRSCEPPINLLLEPVRFKENEFRADLPKDYVYWVLQARQDTYEMDDATLLSLTPQDVAALAVKTTAHWHPSFHALFGLQEAGQTSMLPILSARTDIPIWKSSGHVTLIGDAIHAMSPTAGVGAVTALRDAATLAKLMEEEGVSAEGLEKYETSMRQDAKAAITRSQIGGSWLFGMRPFEELKPVAL